MKTVHVQLDGNPIGVDYEVQETDKGTQFRLSDIAAELGMGSEYSFRVWESNNIYEIPALDNEIGQKSKWTVVSAILKQEGIDFIE